MRESFGSQILCKSVIYSDTGVALLRLPPRRLVPAALVSTAPIETLRPTSLLGGVDPGSSQVRPLFLRGDTEPLRTGAFSNNLFEPSLEFLGM